MKTADATPPGVRLDDRYEFDGRPYYLNGSQALVRLALLERRRRAAQGKTTAVYVTGYRGSPLGGFDQAMIAAAQHLGPHVVFNPGVNEDLAATAVWGSQQLGVFAEGPYDGVSALWYGKGPGVDRSGDAFKHGNNAGSSGEGGVLVVAGDDHTCKSSTLAHQSEYALADAMIPVLAPSSVSEIIQYGLTGWEMSRFAGLWVGLKVVAEVMDSAQAMGGDPVVDLTVPANFPMPPGGLHLRWPDTPLEQEARLHQHKLPAALAFARANRLDRVTLDSPRACIGVITVGKSYPDTRQALSDLGVDETRAAALGVRLYKVAMPWPLEPQGLREFAAGLDEIVVVEEKRGLIEDQVRQHLYGGDISPRIVGKRDETGAWLFPSASELDADLIAVALGGRIAALTGDRAIADRAAEIARRRTAKAGSAEVQRPPYFCSGCPHSSSTKVPEGSRAFAGIGCHYLVLGMERETAGFTQMGGEGANWVGLAPFSTTGHMFQNMGDGTFFHSGSMAIRAAVSAGVNITYKLLFNHAVAMTGGQQVEGGLNLRRMVEMVAGEGVRNIAIVSDDPAREADALVSEGVRSYPRSELDAVQRRLRDLPGVSVLIHDQSCATELRRMRKRGLEPDPKVAVVINDLVCEGCGDCSLASNCLSVIPVETEFGRKRAIDQSACNKDQTCLQGFCPSFVTLEGARRRRPSAATVDDDADLPAPSLPDVAKPFSLVVAGIGGTGVITVGALLGMAAHIEGKGVRVMDMTGLAQKGGAVVTHVQIARSAEAIHSSKASFGAADLLLACDIVVAAAPDNLGRVSRAHGRIIANDHETVTGEFTRRADFAVPVGALRRKLGAAVEPGRAEFCDATSLAARLLGDAVGANLFLVGYAWQRGLIPLSLDALHQAIDLNGVAVALNKAAFAWGRRAALDLQAVQRAAGGRETGQFKLSTTLGELVDRRVDFLVGYQDKAYAARYRAILAQVEAAEQAVVPGSTKLAAAVARGLFKLMAYKDEYEVARLWTDSGFFKRLAEEFEDGYRLGFHLAPPALAAKDPQTGHLKKRRFGPWIRPVFAVLAKGKALRGTRWDLFGRTAERRAERQLIEDFIALLRDDLLPALTAANLDRAVAVAETPMMISGYGHVKARNMAAAAQRQEELLAAFQTDQAARAVSRSTQSAETPV